MVGHAQFVNHRLTAACLDQMDLDVICTRISALIKFLSIEFVVDNKTEHIRNLACHCLHLSLPLSVSIYQLALFPNASRIKREATTVVSPTFHNSFKDVYLLFEVREMYPYLYFIMCFNSDNKSLFTLYHADSSGWHTV